MGEPRVVAGKAAPALLLRLHVVGAQLRQQLGLGGELGLIAAVAGIQAFELVAPARRQLAEVLAALLTFAILGTHRIAAMLLQPQPRADAFHRGGEGLVEHGVVGDIELLVRQFVKDQARQFAFGAVDEGVEQRVAADPVAPAQRRIGRHAVDADVVALGTQSGSEGIGLSTVEVAAVADAAGDRVAPGLQVQRQRRCRHHVPHRGRSLQIGIGAVAGVVGQLQHLHGKVAHLPGQVQPLLQRGLRVALGQPVVHRFGARHQVEVAANRLAVVVQVATAAAQAQRAGGQQQGAAQPQAGHQPAATRHRIMGEPPRPRPGSRRTTARARCR